MKLPRNINGVNLANKLKKFGYVIIRQTGSHLRLTTLEKGRLELNGVLLTAGLF